MSPSHNGWVLFVFFLLFAYPNAASANEGKGGGWQELEVGGYHVTISNQGEWVKGENVVVVTIADGMGMPLRDANVEILLTPQTDGHAGAEMEGRKTTNNLRILCPE